MAHWIPPHLAPPAGVVRVVQPLEDVLVSRLFGRPLSKLLGQPETSLGEVVFKAQPAASLAKFLPPGADTSDGSHGPPVDPGQVTLL